MFVHLAHVLDPKNVAWPGEPVISIEQDTHLSPEGKPFNSHLLTLPNHFGTHMDGPRHFNTTGVPFDELPMDKFGYLGEEVLLVDLPHRNGPDEIVTKEDLEPFAEELAGKRLLLIRTGFEEKRENDPHMYQNNGIALHSELCKWLSDEFPALDCIGMDWMSIAAPANDHGPEAHRWLLGNYNDHIITGIEDMSLAPPG
ncbi:MAG: cyclase family protein [Flaviflexus sp.]|uniref:cyclase family protein n=1 Tax=Flaviflexus sp. TaxID=1969482 RepID=UPI00352DA4D8